MAGRRDWLSCPSKQTRLMLPEWEAQTWTGHLGHIRTEGWAAGSHALLPCLLLPDLVLKGRTRTTENPPDPTKCWLLTPCSGEGDKFCFPSGQPVAQRRSREGMRGESHQALREGLGTRTGTPTSHAPHHAYPHSLLSLREAFTELPAGWKEKKT